MPPKKGAAKAGSAASKSKGTTDAVLQQDEGIQAIVLLDSPDQRLDPLTTEMPKVRIVFQRSFGCNSKFDAASHSHSATVAIFTPSCRLCYR